MRSFLSALKLCVLAFALSACASTKEYTENFSSLKMSADYSTFVVLGEHYHYVFDAPKILASSLRSDFRQHLTAGFFRPFNVGAGGETSGYVRFQLTDDAKPRDKAQAYALGYQTTKDGLIYYTVFMTGRRYVPREGEPVESPLALDQRYQVQVWDSQRSSDAMRMLSPVYFAAGVGMVIATPAMLLVTVPVIGLKP